MNQKNNAGTPGGRWVEVEFDCMPLRSVPRVDVPLDASPKLAEKILRVKAAIEKHGTLNTYYLHQARCTFHLTNDSAQGMLEFDFEGVLLTDEQDMHARSCDLQVSLRRETCDWLNQAIVDWFSETVRRNVMLEFDRFISAGDLSKTVQRIEQIQQASDQAGGYVGMYL
ncbi:MAG: hypothetical protein KDA45_13265 [Planctomycetales bacterium]|nr:hypothetical protein [Planctomycetales bacterium]